MSAVRRLHALFAKKILIYLERMEIDARLIIIIVAFYDSATIYITRTSMTGENLRTVYRTTDDDDNDDDESTPPPLLYALLVRFGRLLVLYTK
jgi:hypothetical protein